MKLIFQISWLLTFFPSNSYAQAPDIKLLRGPYLQVATTNSILIRWRTDIPAIGKVQYGSSPSALTKEVHNNKPATDHIVKIVRLKPNTKYYYAISGSNKKLQGDKNNSFSTLPVAGQEGVYRIGVFGDPGSPTTLQLKVRDQFLKYLGNKALNAWIALGDIAYNKGLDWEYQAKFFNKFKDILLKKYPLFTVPGNHDYEDSNDVTFYAHDKIEYYRTFSMPVNGESGGVPSHNQAYYSYDIGNIHFLALDSFGEEDSTKLYDTTGPQVQWIKKDLDANKNKIWVIAYWHHPPYSMGSHNSDEQDELIYIRENLIPILERYGVDLVIGGHCHGYERSKMIHGHYGMESTFDPARNNLSSSSGSYDGSPNSCPYIKYSNTSQGTVYLVNGGSSELGEAQKNFPHNAMYYSNYTYGGANLLEVQGNRLEMKWICEDGVVRDQFTIMKNVNKRSEIHIKKGESTILTASFVGEYKWNNNKITKSIKVSPAVSTTFTVRDKYNCVQDTFEVEVSN